MTDPPHPHPPDRRANPTFILTDQSRPLVLGTKPVAGETKPFPGRPPLVSIPARIAVPFMAAVVGAMTVVAVLAVVANQPEPVPITELAPAALAAEHGEAANPGPVY